MKICVVDPKRTEQTRERVVQRLARVFYLRIHSRTMKEGHAKKRTGGLQRSSAREYITRRGSLIHRLLFLPLNPPFGCFRSNWYAMNVPLRGAGKSLVSCEIRTAYCLCQSREEVCYTRTRLRVQQSLQARDRLRLGCVKYLYFSPFILLAKCRQTDITRSCTTTNNDIGASNHLCDGARINYHP